MLHEREDKLFRLQQPKVGQLHVQPYKNGEWVGVRVELSKEQLVVHRRDLVYEDTIANHVRSLDMCVCSIYSFLYIPYRI